jgi:phage-related protein (TIGR01555 family)
MLLNDGLINLTANLGTLKDKSTSTGWAVTPRVAEEWEILYRASAFARKIIDIPTGDMVRRWRTWNAEEDDVALLEAAERRFKVKSVIKKAHRWARLYGSSAIIIGAAPRLGRSDEPLLIDRMGAGDLTYLHVDVYPRLMIEAWNTDLESPEFGRPLFYRYTPVVRGSNGQQVRIHASRVIPFSGMTLPPFAAINTQEWGDSIFTALETVLNTAGTATAVIASMLPESKIDIIKTDLKGLGTADGESRLMKRFGLAAMLKSTNNMLLMGNDESYEQKTLNFAGLSDIHIRMLQELAGAADIPVTRLLGQAPAGLQSTGESDLRNYYDSLSDKQENELREPMERVDALLMAHTGVALDAGVYFTFNSLWQESETQKAENALKRAQATQIYVNSALLPDAIMQKAVLAQMVEAGDYPGLDAIVKKHEQDNGPIEDEPEAEEAAPAVSAERPRLRVVGDAAPRPLYVCRKVENANEILAWARGQGLTSLLTASDLHVTVVYSRAPLDWFVLGSVEDKIMIPRGGPRQMDKFGDATVLLFSSWSLNYRHEEAAEAGASWDHAEYQSHITLSTSGQTVDLTKIEPYQGKIVLGPEIFETIEEGAAA